MQTKRIVSLEDAGQTAKGTPYWKVTWDDGKFDNIFSEEFHDLLVEADERGVAVNIEKEKSGKYWNVTNLTLAEEGTPSANLLETPVETHKKSEISGQEMGLWWKELGESIRSGEIDKSFPKSAVKIKGQYYKKMFDVTGVEKE